MPRSPSIAVAGGRVSIVMLIFVVFIAAIFLTASIGILNTVGGVIPLWILLLIVSLLGVGIMFGAAAMAAKSHLH